jgi:hypothetical protein
MPNPEIENQRWLEIFFFYDCCQADDANPTCSPLVREASSDKDEKRSMPLSTPIDPMPRMVGRGDR